MNNGSCFSYKRSLILLVTLLRPLTNSLYFTIKASSSFKSSQRGKKPMFSRYLAISRLTRLSTSRKQRPLLASPTIRSLKLSCSLLKKAFFSRRANPEKQKFSLILNTSIFSAKIPDIISLPSLDGVFICSHCVHCSNNRTEYPVFSRINNIVRHFSNSGFSKTSLALTPLTTPFSKMVSV